ncbi:GmrSD restriction endonuclease domain-containing protein [Aeromicrobium massiliense]|uniref:GmrSD restriction endonuclease domain-containing protein n=1 Tax=Aeromicrobium massiliense TaxID=1464554 RepID=UPI0009DA343A|nr:DUF1524 domain-containing protein [Aeromicrobium massiliense]
MPIFPRTARAAAVAVLTLLGACSAVPAAEPTATPTVAPTTSAPSPSTSASTTPSAPPAAGTALTALRALPVKGRSARTGYDRERFGAAWLDADRNGCDTRNDVLAAHLSDVQVKPGTRGCVVLSGVLADPYTGRAIAFARGAGNGVDVDHVVALSNAWVTGAASFPLRKRAALANDPLNLLPVDASANRQKGDGDAATWLPPHRPVRCAYVARQVAVKAKYGLWVTPAEKQAVERVLDGCPAQPLPVDESAAPVLVPLDLREPTPATDGTVLFGSCADARAAGAAPVRRGDPGYGPHLDRDGDGRACE